MVKCKKLRTENIISFILISSETYHVEPITNHLMASKHHNRIIYKDSDVNYDLLNNSCPSVHSPRLRGIQVSEHSYIGESYCGFDVQILSETVNPQ